MVMSRVGLSLLAAIVVVVVLFGEALLGLGQLWTLAVVGVAVFAVTYWAVNEEHRRGEG